MSAGSSSMGPLDRAFRFGGFARVTLVDGINTPKELDVLRAKQIKLLGTLTAEATLILPHFPGADWIVRNETTGGFAVLVKGPSGAGVSIEHNKQATVTTDGTKFTREVGTASALTVTQTPTGAPARNTKTIQGGATVNETDTVSVVTVLRDELELTGRRYPVEAYGGGTAKTGAENRTALAAAWAAVAAAGGGEIVFEKAGTYNFDSQVIGASNTLLRGKPGTKLVFAPGGTYTTNSTCMSISGSRVEQGAMSSANKDATQIVLANAGTALAKGDLILIYDSTDFGFSLWRSYYRKGEFAVVDEVAVAASTTVTLSEPLLDSYTAGANLHVYKVTPAQVSLEDIEIVGPGAASGVSGVHVQWGRGVSFDGVRVTNCPNGGIVLAECYDATLGKMRAWDAITASGAEYGLAILGSQRVTITGSNLSAGRHGLTMGGSTIPNRHITIDSCIISSLARNGIWGADMHGNCEYVDYIACRAPRGMMIAGDHTRIIDCEIGTGSAAGVALMATEWLGWDHQVIDTTLRATAAVDSSYGLFTISDSGMEKLSRGGGQLRIDGLRFEMGAYSGKPLYLYNVIAGAEAELADPINHPRNNGRVLLQNLSGNYTGQQSSPCRIHVRADNGVAQNQTPRGFRSVVVKNCGDLHGIGLLLDGLNAEYVEVDSIGTFSAAGGAGLEKVPTAAVTPLRTTELVVVRGCTSLTAYQAACQIGGESQTFSVGKIEGNTLLDASIIGAGDSSERASLFAYRFKQLVVRGNEVGDRKTPKTQVRLMAFADITTLYETDNTPIDDDGGNLTVNYTNVPNHFERFSWRGQLLECWGTAAPVAGRWYHGSIVWNRTPTAGSPICWRKVDAGWGIPGTWEAITAGGSGADASVAFVTIGNTAALANERALTGTAFQISVTDGGAGGAVTIALADLIAGGTFAYPSSITLDAKGRVTSITAGSAPAPTTPTYITVDVELGLPNSVPLAGTAGRIVVGTSGSGSGGEIDLAATMGSGGSFTTVDNKTVTYDLYGRIVSVV